MPDYYNRDKFTSGRPGGPGTPPPRNGPPPWGRTPPPPPRYHGGRRPGRGAGDVDWGIFILLLIFIWPAAIAYLLYKLLNNQKAVRQVSDTINQAESIFRGGKAAGQGAQTARQETRADDARETAEVRDDGPSGSRQAAQAQSAAADAAAGQASPPDQSAAKKDGAKQDVSPEKNLPSNVRSTVFRVVGACVFFAGAVALTEELDSLFRGYLFLEDLVAAGFFTLGGIALFTRGQLDAVFRRRGLKYIRALGDVDAMALGEVAKRVGRPQKQVVRDLKKLIDKGYLGDDAYLDLEAGYFLRYGAAVAPPPQAETATDKKEAEDAAEHPYAAILQNIRHANDRIADEALSAKIDRLEEITRQILQEVAEHPEKREGMRTFFDYYLPTTQKLLDSYADFEDAGVEGENLGEAKRRIESTMDSIVAGFERQLDALFQADAMDVESDIRVMEAMLRRDSASAARDFGYDRQSQRQGE